MTIPEHFAKAFPWIQKPASKLKAKPSNAVGKKWLEHRIIFDIFQAPKSASDDFRSRLIKSLAKCDNDKQIKYIEAIAACLADEVIATPLPDIPKEWLNDVNKAAKRLRGLLSQRPKRELPSNWNDLLPVVRQFMINEISNGVGFSVHEEQLISPTKETIKFASSVKFVGELRLG